MRKVNYDKFPSTKISGTILRGWNDIHTLLMECFKSRKVLAVELYAGVCEDEVINELKSLSPTLLINTRDLMKPENEIKEMTERFMTKDVLFGYVTNLSLKDYFDAGKLEVARKLVAANDRVIVVGSGAAMIAQAEATLVYVDMARWEIQQRFRAHEVKALGVDNREDAVSLQYKRGYFNDWRVLDKYKEGLFDKADFWLDTHIANDPRMIDRETFFKGIEETIKTPFRVVPFFDPAPWGGQWMKEVCGLNPEKENYGWCFDCVPEENSLYLNVEGELFEMPSNNVVFHQTRALLGGPVESRFGQDFPIRFDFLDTIGGGNLSLQVHPTTQYIRDTFGIYYTQDESYYLLDAEEGATVFLGLKTGVNPEEMIGALQESQNTGKPFEAEKYVNRWPAKKHDHFLIPNGTIHCSGAGAMVLEISATPSIFTFKLWDWGRLGLDGLPRPINIGHGSHVIQWERQTEFTRDNLVNQVKPIAEGDGRREERTGLHENEFIETRRHWFTKPVTHHTDDGVNVFNVIEGDELIVESPTNAFEPFVVHYAETFIVPASVGEYTIRPYGTSEGKECGTIKAYVRFRQ